MSRWTKRLLRTLKFSPVVAAALLVALWLSVPMPLAGRMISMSASGVPALDPLDGETDRFDVATDYFRSRAVDKASKGWADVRFRQAARRSWLLMPDDATEKQRVAQEPFALGREHMAFAPLKAFLREFPDVRVAAYVVPHPTRPENPREGIAFPRSLPRMEELRALDATSPYGAAWRLTQADAKRVPFDRQAWIPNRMYQPERVRGIWSHVEFRANAFYRTLVIGAGDGSRAGAEESSALHGILKRLPDTNACAACHSAHSSFAPSSSAWPGSFANPDGTVPTPAAAWYAGPVDVRAVTQFSSSVDASPSLRPAALAAAIEGKSTSRWGAVVWAGDTMKDADFEKPTMLFTASFPEDPHAAFKARQASPLVARTTALRVALAAFLPWLLVGGAALLGVTLVGSAGAYSVEQNLLARQRAREDLERVQRDAHDRVYNRLTALAKQVEQLGPDTADSREAIAEDIRGTVGDLQSILGDVREGTPPMAGALAEQLHAVASAQQARYGVQVSLVVDTLPALPAPLGWDLQCVLEEAITNAVRHGSARRIRAAVSSDGTRLRLRVEDDGTGLGDRGEQGNGRSSGLRGMRARLERWGGSVDLRSEADATVLEALAPLP